MNILLNASFNRSLFVNGLNQNVIFLAEMLKDMGYNISICVNHDVEECQDPPLDILIMEEHEIEDYEFDYVLQISWIIKPKIINNLKNKNPRCKNVHVHYGNRLFTDYNLIASETTMPLSREGVDEIWVSPHYDFSVPYLKTYYRNQKVFEIPYIWSPKYVHNNNIRYDSNKTKNIAISEPNLNFTKSCLIPIMAAEEVVRSNDQLFDLLYCFCTEKYRDKNYFKNLIFPLDLHKKDKIRCVNRYPVETIFSLCNVLLSHQHYNELNYTHLEALYLDVPLIHNSSLLGGAGYYYPEFNTILAGKQLSKALSLHDENLDHYRKKSKSILWKFSPENELVRDQYKKLFL